MRLASDVGDFEVEIHNVTRQRDTLVLAVQMGVWDAHLYVSSGDFERLFNAAPGSTRLFIVYLPVLALARLVVRRVFKRR